jgi:hypothetical protein
MNTKKKKQIDPLFQLFEQYLLTRSYDDSAAFTKQLAKEYVAYLDSTPAHVPMHVRAGVLEDLELECHEMLVKKMYGVVSATDYQNRGKVIAHQSKEDGFQPVDLTKTTASDDQAKE